MWGIQLKRHSQISLSRQIYNSLRSQIMEGQLKKGEALPSTRELAKLLDVSRNTVCEAYEMLQAEGFIESRQGSKTLVAVELHLDKKSHLPDKHQKIFNTAPNYRADFRTGQPDMRKFPKKQWLQLLNKTTQDMPLTQWGYSGPQGIPDLREEIAAWLFRSKGISVDPEDIFITAGSTQALHLLADLLHIDNSEIIVEDPCHVGMLRVFEGKGFKVRAIPVDKHGIQTQYLNGSKAFLVYVTPSHQFPLGGILPAERRASLIEYAIENGAYIIEDDYDSEFRYSGSPISPLYTMAPQKVIYVGTFSKILFPALRIGYVILPRPLHLPWCRLRTHVDVQNPPFEQAALAQYMHTRSLDRHIQKMRRLYGQRRQILLDSLYELFGSAWHPWGDAAGLHIALEFPGWQFDMEFRQKCKEYGIYITPVEHHCITKGTHKDKLLLGYGHLDSMEIRSGISLLHGLMEEIFRCPTEI